MILCIISHLLIKSLPLFANPTCERWFIESGIKPNTVNCEIDCSSVIVDMGTFDCPNKCKDLCKSTVPSSVIDAMSNVKGLTEGDKSAISKYPQDALKVYMAKKKTDELTIKVFGHTGRNDESDAFRHFIWASLLVTSVGVEKANIFLTAHEQDPSQKVNEKEMDIFNNKKGIEFAVKQLEQKKSLELDVIEQAALQELKKGHLKVLKSSNKKIPEGYYSN